MLEDDSKIKKSNLGFYLPFIIILMAGFFLLSVFRPPGASPDQFSLKIEGLSVELEELEARLGVLEANVANMSSTIRGLNFSSRYSELESLILANHDRSLWEIATLQEDFDDLREGLLKISHDWSQLENDDDGAGEFSIASLFESVVSIQVASFSDGEAYVSKGSGFIYSENGNIVTSYHVVENEAWGIEVVFNDGSISEGSLVAYDDDYDIALLKVKPHKALTPVSFGNSSKVTVGEPVAVVGNPFGYGSTLTTGIVSQTQRTLSMDEKYLIPGIIQFDAAANYGNSGGLLFNWEGQVIGMVAADVNPMYGEGVNFAVPSNILRYVLPVVLEDGRFRHPYIGIVMKPVSLKVMEAMYLNSTDGVLIVEVFDDSPAKAAGLRGGSESIRYILESTKIGGDVILRIDDEPIYDMEDLGSFIDEHRSPGDQVSIQILRNGRKKTVSLVLGERPSS
ncbi:MAG: trypsin-like peptidase domain-containing protein [Candidatus Bathyarchaeota archaeon]|nr:MAG: trypsin-like peptidase domain-containing protein [Candidatus Bathyarchaeota archaeon]